MAQTFGILGFLLALLALFFASEVMRRATHRQAALEAALFKATTRIQKIESKMVHVDRLAAEVRYEKKRQAETISALAKKGGIKTDSSSTPGRELKTRRERSDSERFTPSTHKTRAG